MCQGAGVAAPGIYPIVFTDRGYRGQLDWLGDTAAYKAPIADQSYVTLLAVAKEGDITLPQHIMVELTSGQQVYLGPKLTTPKPGPLAKRTTLAMTVTCAGAVVRHLATEEEVLTDGGESEVEDFTTEDEEEDQKEEDQKKDELEKDEEGNEMNGEQKKQKDEEEQERQEKEEDSTPPALAPPPAGGEEMDSDVELGPKVTRSTRQQGGEEEEAGGSEQAKEEQAWQDNEYHIKKRKRSLCQESYAVQVRHKGAEADTN